MLFTKIQASEIEIKCIITEIKSEIEQSINSSIRESTENLQANLFVLTKNIKDIKEQIIKKNQNDDMKLQPVKENDTKTKRGLDSNSDDEVITNKRVRKEELK